MIKIEELPPDQRAALSLLLRARKRYDDVAAALGVPASAVHDRAHAALAVLAPSKARLVEGTMREQIGEYLLGQQGKEQAAATKAHLESSTAAREWARALAIELRKLAAEPLPEIPAGEQAVDAAAHVAGGAAAPAMPAAGAPPRPAAPISRRGGAILLSAIAAIAVAIVVVVLVTGKEGGGSNPGANQTASHSSANTGSGPGQAAGQGSGSGNSSSSIASTSIEKVAELKPPSGAGAEKGAAAIAAENGKHALLLSATGMPATNGFFYVVWLIGPEGKARPFGRTPSVGSKGTIRAVELLSADPSKVSGIELTRETNPRPRSPGSVVLKGNFNHG